MSTNFNAFVGSRISQLRNKARETQADLAKELGLNRRETIMQWEMGSRQIKGEALVKLARHFNVSTDFLLGLTNIESPEIDMQLVGKYTGLSDDAIRNLSSLIEPPAAFIDPVDVRRPERIRTLISAIFSADAIYPFLDCLLNIDTCCMILSAMSEDFPEDDSVDELTRYSANLSKKIKNLRFALFELSELSTILADEIYQHSFMKKEAEAKLNQAQKQITHLSLTNQTKGEPHGIISSEDNS